MMVSPVTVARNKAIPAAVWSIALCPQCLGAKAVMIAHSGLFEECKCCRGEGVVEVSTQYQYFNPVDI